MLPNDLRTRKGLRMAYCGQEIALETPGYSPGWSENSQKPSDWACVADLVQIP